MINNKKIVVVMPAYNAALTLEKTYRELPFDIIDDVILVDDASTDDTCEVAASIGIKHVLKHDENLGYGGNQKTCYQHALALGADIVIMVHPDYQYTPKLIRAMASMIADGIFDCALGSRILGVGALKGGMPTHKYIANRLLTFIQNILVGYKLSEYHTGYRAFSSEILKDLPLQKNSDDFIFDNQMLLQIIANNFSIGELTCPTRYTADASSIAGWSAIRYGCGVLIESVKYKLTKLGLMKSIYS
ncbi:MAG: glycosyltransferase family 2 protein [Gammaproteobacteria bacterium]|nr:MAG: glycosyltransferase family 2 protein [Gammaproteobacteria bacterium]